MERGYKLYDINELNPGDHLSVLYETDEEHKALITPYIRSGLENNVDFHPIDDQYEFTVKDNGIGFPEDLDFHNTNSLGMQMVTSLTEQIDGEIELNRNQGTEFKITFKDLGIN